MVGSVGSCCEVTRGPFLCTVSVTDGRSDGPFPEVGAGGCLLVHSGWLSLRAQAPGLSTQSAAPGQGPRGSLLHGSTRLPPRSLHRAGVLPRAAACALRSDSGCCLHCTGRLHLLPPGWHTAATVFSEGVLECVFVFKITVLIQNPVKLRRHGEVGTIRIDCP